MSVKEECILCGKAEWEEIHALCKNCQGKIQRDRGIAKAVKDKAQRSLAVPPLFQGLSFLDGYMSKHDGVTMPGFVMHTLEHAMFNSYSAKSSVDALALDLEHLLTNLKGGASETYRGWREEVDELKKLAHELHTRLNLLLPEWRRIDFDRGANR